MLGRGAGCMIACPPVMIGRRRPAATQTDDRRGRALLPLLLFLLGEEQGREARLPPNMAWQLAPTKVHAIEFGRLFAIN